MTFPKISYPCIHKFPLTQETSSLLLWNLEPDENYANSKGISYKLEIRDNIIYLIIRAGTVHKHLGVYVHSYEYTNGHPLSLTLSHNRINQAFGSQFTTCLTFKTIIHNISSHLPSEIIRSNCFETSSSS